MSTISLEGNLSPIILNLINSFSFAYSDMIEGRFLFDSMKECLGGSRINYIFHTVFSKAINDINPLANLDD